jgi:predicted DCC family thiol-disulfide oxidoreductase YuxK
MATRDDDPAGGGVAHHHPLVVYDGVCRLCNGTVAWLIRHDAARVLCFCASQSRRGTELLAAHGVSRETAQASIVLIQPDGSVLLRSSAAAAIAAYLDWPWRAAAAMWVVPSPLRDAVYGAVSTNRYKLFGRSDTCLTPSRDILDRFIDAEELRRGKGDADGAGGVEARSGGDGHNG